LHSESPYSESRYPATLRTRRAQLGQRNGLFLPNNGTQAPSDRDELDGRTLGFRQVGRESSKSVLDLPGRLATRRSRGCSCTLQEGPDRGFLVIGNWRAGRAIYLRMGDLAMDSERRTRISGIVQQVAEREQQRPRAAGAAIMLTKPAPTHTSKS
jgi:hypothetical protein